MFRSALSIAVGGGSKVEGWLPAEIVSQYPDVDLKRDIRKEEPHDWWHYLSPTLMYNGMLKPLQNYTIKGFLWYQGESNVGLQNLRRASENNGGPLAQGSGGLANCLSILWN